MKHVSPLDPSLLLIGVEDTDVEGAELGTGKITRRLKDVLPTGAEMVGVVRHQFLMVPEIPYTSWNSPACAIVRVSDTSLVPEIAEATRDHVRALASNGSDPGICLGLVRDVAPRVIEHGVDCRRRVLTQADAIRTGKGLILEGLGGDNGGIIGALGAVGLTAHGWCGRFIEVTALEERPLDNSVADLAECGVRLAVMERDAPPPLDEDRVIVPDQFRPVLIGGVPVLMVHEAAPGRWETKPWPKRNH
ncbi:hypothetical protein PVV74_11255 [Roseovarius sp. SK2]|uniref:hypothetical protein n=1 Tax=Roseovarius TaxID=74030 RepID=UPI00237A7FE1|nr:hypothetical protein [Roseovarius sp. SK2]MDD9726033.1 hypothetical protein [Roseovarius sp. SK2]